MFVLSVVMAGSRRRHRSRHGDRRRRGGEGHRQIAGDDRRSEPGDLLAGDLRQQHGGRCCWAGRSTDHVPFKGLVVALAAVPLMVLVPCCACRGTPPCRFPVTRSIAQFWAGLNSGSDSRDHAVLSSCSSSSRRPDRSSRTTRTKALHFTQSQIGIATSAGMAGYFAACCCSVWKGVRLAGALRHAQAVSPLHRRRAPLFGLTQYALLDPWFSGDHGRAVARAAVPRRGPVPGRASLPRPAPCVTAATSLFWMSTYSLVGAVVPRRGRGQSVRRLHVGRQPRLHVQLRERRLALRPRHGARAAARPAARSVRDRPAGRPTSCRCTC